MNSKKICKTGFTLIDCLIALVIVGILALIAFPSYREHITKARRAEAYALLLSAASDLEELHTTEHTYEGAKISANNKWYKIEVDAKAHEYVLKAIPQDTQAVQDMECGTLVLSHLGERKVTGYAGVARCWG